LSVVRCIGLSWPPSARRIFVGAAVLVDYIGRLFRDGKAAISAELNGILERLGSSAEGWRARLEKLKSGLWVGFCR
jgi:hypothetical protein